jgi:colicin import membrane protein
MREFLRENSGPVIVSVLLHGLLAAGLILTAVISARRTPPTLQPLPIDAVVVDSQILHAAQHAQEERAAQAAARARAEAQAAAAAAKAADDARAADEAKSAAAAQAETDAAAAAKAGAADQAAAKAAEQAKAVDAAAAAAAADKAKAAQATKSTAAAAEQQRAADAQKAAAAQKAAQARRAAEADLAEEAKRAADAKKAADAKQAAEAKQAEEAKQIAEAKQAADQRARQDREAELRKQLADEEHRSAVESGPLRDSYIARLRNRIQSAWIKPPSASVGLDCLVEVTQVPGGEVTGARVTQCNGDAAARQSIENAVYRASPLPDPPDPALFERNFVFRFKPNE